MLGEIVRARTVGEPERPEGPRDQAAGFERADAQGTVDTLTHEIDVAIAAAELQLNFRVPCEKTWSCGRHLASRDATWQVDTQTSLHGLNGGEKEPFQFLTISDQGGSPLAQRRAVFGHADAPRGAIE